MTNTSQVSVITTELIISAEPCHHGNQSGNLSLISGNVTDVPLCSTGEKSAKPNLHDYSEFTIAVFLNQYSLYFILGIGFPGNIAALATAVRMTPITSSSLYIIVLATMDSIGLIVKEFYFQLTWHNIKLYDVGCRVLIFTGTFAMQCSNWVLVAMTVERFIAIIYPFKVYELCTKRKAVYVLLLIILVLVGLNLHHLFILKEGLHPDFVYVCAPKTEFSQFFHTVWYWIDGAAYAFIPCFALTICNTLIIVGIRSSLKKKKELTNAQQMQTNQQMQITVMLVTVSVVFIVLTMPNCIFFIYEKYWNYRENAKELATYYLVYQIIIILSDLNHAVNFYLYFLSGRKFRKNFFMMMRCKSSQKDSSTVRSNMPKKSKYVVSSTTTITTSNDSIHSSENGIYKGALHGSVSLSSFID